MSAHEASPLLTPAAVSQRHRLAPPAVRFPGHSDANSLERQDSYGFPCKGTTTTTSSDSTLVSPSDTQQAGFGRLGDPRQAITREDSKVYTSFPHPTGTPWRDLTTPAENHDSPFFSHWFSSNSKKADGTSDNARHTGDIESRGSPIQPGLPKVTRACLWAEIKCYGRYIFPTIFVFVILVLVIALGIFYRVRG